MLVSFGGDQYVLTTTFGAVDSWHRTAHTGLDIAMKCGTPLKSPTNGVIEKVFDYGSQNAGKGIIIQTNDGEHLIFGHLSENGGAHVGQPVHVNDVIGFSGNSGASSGCHLHLGLRDSLGQFVDPSKYLDSGGGTGVHHIASIPRPEIAQTLTEILSSNMHQFCDSIANMSLQFIQLFAIPKASLILDLILSHLI